MEEYFGFMPKLREFFKSIGVRENKFDHISFNSLQELPCDEIGDLCYNDADHTLDLKIETDVTMQIGQETFVRVVNKTGSLIENGKCVFINSAQGNRPTIALANNTNYLESIKCIGLTTHDIAINAEGFVTVFGLVRDVNTNNMTEGAILYLGINGNYTTTRPTSPTFITAIGNVVVEHSQHGVVAVKTLPVKNEFGDPTNNNYTYFESDGTLKMVGTATVFNDLPPRPIIASRVPAVNNPTLTTFVGNIQQYTFAVNDYVMDNLEVMHEYREGTPISMHVHLATNGTNVDNRYVKFEIEYTIANNSSMFVSATPISAEILIPANTASKTHSICYIGDIPGTGIQIGSIICYNIKRITSTGTAPTSNPFVLQVSGHIEIDTIGSRQLYTK